MIAKQHHLAAVFAMALAATSTASLAQDTAAPATPPVPPAPATSQETPAPSTAAPTPSQPAGPAVDAAAIAQDLSPVIEDVQVVGPWTSGDASGVWRTLMVQTPDKPSGYSFFVQQLSGAGADLTLNASTEITEINELDGAVVGYRADEPSPEQPNSLTLYFDVVPADGEIAETYQLYFFPDAPYDFGPATN